MRPRRRRPRGMRPQDPPQAGAAPEGMSYETPSAPYEGGPPADYSAPSDAGPPMGDPSNPPGAPTGGYSGPNGAPGPGYDRGYPRQGGGRRRRRRPRNGRQQGGEMQQQQSYPQPYNQAAARRAHIPSPPITPTKTKTKAPVGIRTLSARTRPRPRVTPARVITPSTTSRSFSPHAARNSIDLKCRSKSLQARRGSAPDRKSATRNMGRGLSTSAKEMGKMPRLRYNSPGSV